MSCRSNNNKASVWILKTRRRLNMALGIDNQYPFNSSDLIEATRTYVYFYHIESKTDTKILNCQGKMRPLSIVGCSCIKIGEIKKGMEGENEPRNSRIKKPCRGQPRLTRSSIWPVSCEGFEYLLTLSFDISDKHGEKILNLHDLKDIRQNCTGFPCFFLTAWSQLRCLWIHR